MMKHQAAAARLVQHRGAVIAQLTVPAREIFLELEALYTGSRKAPEGKE